MSDSPDQLQEGPQPSDAAGALCPHFGECGGCASQDVPYGEQLRGKQAFLQETFAPFWQEAIPVDPSPTVWHYRNKVDVNFDGRHYPEPPPKGFQREAVLGFKRKGQWYHTLDIETCRIAPEGTDALLHSVRAWARAKALPAFSARSKKGFLRILLVREGRRTGERMVVLITNEGVLDTESFCEAVLSAYPATSIHWGVYRGVAGIAVAEEMTLLHGAPTIDEELRVPDGESCRVLRFRISPFSFFQTNTLATERLYGMIRERVRALAPETLYDLYGGSGGIAFTCADLVERVVSVESVPEASVDGRFNADVNGIHNVVFHTAKVEHFLRDLLQDGEGLADGSAVVLDPPRAGLHPKALRRLIELRPPHILYVACKPAVLASQDLPGLLESYDLVDLTAVDLFPHTPHVEALAYLRRK